MPSSADGERHVVLPREVDAGDHIGDVGCRSCDVLFPEK
jgi:hypothetical protein